MHTGAVQQSSLPSLPAVSSMRCALAKELCYCHGVLLAATAAGAGQRTRRHAGCASLLHPGQLLQLPCARADAGCWELLLPATTLATDPSSCRPLLCLKQYRAWSVVCLGRAVQQGVVVRSVSGPVGLLKEH
jgi:hypothetical protein